MTALSPHVRAQLLRWARSTAAAFLPLFIAAGWRWPGWDAVWPVAAGLVEPGLRQLRPVKLTQGRADPSP